MTIAQKTEPDKSIVLARKDLIPKLPLTQMDKVTHALRSENMVYQKYHSQHKNSVRRVALLTLLHHPPGEKPQN